MELRQRVRRRLLWLRLGQSLLAGAAGAFAAGLTAAAEGLAPLPLALCAALLMMALVLLVGRPWIEPELAVDPRFDADGLLRTALCTKLRPAQREALVKVAAARPLRLRPLPDWQLSVPVAPHASQRIQLPILPALR